MRNIRAPLDIFRAVPAKRPHWRPLCLDKEKMSSSASLLNLLQFTRDSVQHTRPVVPVLCHKNIHYRICKLMFDEKTTGLECLTIFVVTPYILRFLARVQFLCYTNIWLILADCDVFLLRSVAQR